MRVRVQPDNFQPPQVVEGLRSVVIYDDFDAPILLVQKVEKGQIITYRANDPKFIEALKALGIGLNAKYQELTTR